ncbi:MAG: hypothetical protein ACOYY2_03900 [Actinomycetota bacterium]
MARVVPDDETLARLLREHTQTEIARMYGVSDVVVHKHAKRLGLAPGRPRYDTYLPWTLAPEHRHSTVATYLRTLGRIEAGGAVPEVKAKPARSFAARLREQGKVVTYSPATGFREVKARPGEDLVRR